MRKTGFSMDYIQKNRSVMRVIECSIRNHWTSPAFSDYNTSISFTFQDLANQIRKMHIFFKENGIKKGDKVAVCDKNSSYWAISTLAALTYGAVVVPILVDFHGDQIVNVVNHSDSKMMFTSPIVRKKIEKALTAAGSEKLDHCEFVDISIVGEKDPTIDLTPDDVHYFTDDPDGLALINYTSGSTGFSKGVMLPYRCIWSNVAFGDEKLGLRECCKVLSLLPMAHMYGFTFEYFYEFCMGGHITFLTKPPSPTVLAKALSDIKPDVLICVPLIVEKIIQSRVFPKLKSLATQSLMVLPFVKGMIYRKIRQRIIDFFGGQFYEVIVGGAAFNQEVENFLSYIKFPYTVGYGMTECGPIICYRDYHTFVPRSCGQVVPRMELKVLSQDPANVEGEIVVRGDNVMLGYYKNEEATRAAIDSEGWLHTGDLGTVDSDGNVFIRGRQKNMLLGANGQNIYPEEIEEKFTSHALIDECVVVQRDQQLIGLVYTSDETLKAHGLSREEFISQLPRYCKYVNGMLPSFYKVTKLESMDTEFEKTPKRNIKRFLYK
jgi:long-chain acyl-CoA synthetase